MAEEKKGKDLRAYPRFDLLECAVLYREGSPDPFRAMIVDIGIGGVQLRTKENLPLNETLTLHIGQDGKKPIAVPGFVRYCHASTEGDGIFESGFKFTPTTHAQRATVAEYVHDVFMGQWMQTGTQ